MLDIFAVLFENLDKFKGIEKELFKRKRNSLIGLVISLVAAAAGGVKKIFIDTEAIESSDVALLGIAFVALLGYLVTRLTGFLLKEIERPFSYTFQVDDFKRIAGTPCERFKVWNDDRFALMSYDIREKLNTRIKRLYLVDEKESGSNAATGENAPSDISGPINYGSHIYISGDYAVRENKDGQWILHVLPFVRIGPKGSPATMAHSVEFPLPIDGKAKYSEMTAAQYHQVVERVYSHVASEIYKQIKIDMGEKLTLFPTPYLRAVALYNEAKDFERSNTIDAYDYAIQLYRESKRYFDVANLKKISVFLRSCPLLWRIEKTFLFMEAQTRTGYAKCIIYRMVVSALSGRRQNTIYEAPDEAQKAIDTLGGLYEGVFKGAHERMFGRFSPKRVGGENLRALLRHLTFPDDYFWSRRKLFFDKCTMALSNAYVVRSLALAYLDDFEEAQKCLDSAEAFSSTKCRENALWLFAAAEICQDRTQKLLLLRQATELTPDFEIAQYRLAQSAESRLRLKSETNDHDKVEAVIKEYDEVLRINPANIGAIAAQGYLYWLLCNITKHCSSDTENDDCASRRGEGPKPCYLKRARKRFEEGIENKAIVRETYVAELNYGLARVAAEEASLKVEADVRERLVSESYRHYTQALSTDPSVGAYSVAGSSGRTTTSYYGSIDSSMLNRYERFARNIKEYTTGSSVGNRTYAAVYSFALNDYGNACLNFYCFHGDGGKLYEAVKNYRKAAEMYKANLVVHYNLYQAYVLQGSTEDELKTCLVTASKLAPTWSMVVTEYAKSQIMSDPAKIIEDTAGAGEEAAASGKRDEYYGVKLTASSPLWKIMQQTSVKFLLDFEEDEDEDKDKDERCFNALISNVRRLTTSEIKKDRLCSDDIAVLQVLALAIFKLSDALSVKLPKLKESGRKAAQGICELIFKQHAMHFETNRMLLEERERWKKDEENREQR